MRQILAAIFTALGITLSLAASAFAWQGRAEGRPVSFSAGSASGVYLWHDEPIGFSLRTTDPLGQHHAYTGTIVTDGVFTNVSAVAPEADDSVSVDGSGHVLSFSFHTFSQIDGVDYEIAGGTSQQLDLQIDGLELPPAAVFMGAFSVHPRHVPFSICRADDFSCPPLIPGSK
jgi:hypothetical protein